MWIRKRLGAVALAASLVIGGAFVSGTAEAATSAVNASMYNAGQFCSAANEGKVITSDNGKTIQCRYVNGYRRWVVK